MNNSHCFEPGIEHRCRIYSLGKTDGFSFGLSRCNRRNMSRIWKGMADSFLPISLCICVFDCSILTLWSCFHRTLAWRRNSSRYCTSSSRDQTSLSAVHRWSDWSYQSIVTCRGWPPIVSRSLSPPCTWGWSRCSWSRCAACYWFWWSSSREDGSGWSSRSH